MQTTPATTLDDIYRTLRPEPLQIPEELAAFYRLQMCKNPDPVLYALLNARAVQAFNGQHWLGCIR